MIELGQHWEFVVAAYGGCFLLVAALIGWTVIDARRVRARVAALEVARDRQRTVKD